jgi:hypothetical protein
MAATQAAIDALRLCITVPDGKEDAFNDDLLAGFLEAHPLRDAAGLWPNDSNWTPTYDGNAAAADLWGLIAASGAQLYDFSADGATYTRSQLHAQALRMAKHFRAHSAATSEQLERSRVADILYTARWPYVVQATREGDLS